MGYITVRLDNVLRMYAQRNQQAMTLTDVAQRTGISEGELAKLQDNEADDIGLNMLAKLCDVLHCMPQELLVYTPDMPAVLPDAVDSKEIVSQWETQYGEDEHPRQ